MTVYFCAVYDRFADATLNDTRGYLTRDAAETRASRIEAWGRDLRAHVEELDVRGVRTCSVELFDDGYSEGLDGEWYSYGPPTWELSCGHTCEGRERPCFCPVCGAEVVG